MGCSPEQARLNGAKSKGAVTERGREIASRNATKHGLLAKQPPLLATEDLATFQGLVQGLIEHYQPESPVEHFLIQQIAMGMIKQYRLWNVETAIVSVEILKAKQLIKFPDYVVSPESSLDEFDLYRERRIPRKTLLVKEKSSLQKLIDNLEDDCSQLQKQGQSKTLAEFEESLEVNYYHEDRTRAVWQYQDDLCSWLRESRNESKKRCVADFQEAIARVMHLIALARQAVEEIEQTLEEFEVTEQGIKQAEIISKGMHQQELFSRYQRNINRDLYEALDKLEAIQQRRDEGSIGSFGQN